MTIFLELCLPRDDCLPRKTDSNNPADWLWFAASDLEMIRHAAEHELSFVGARSKLAEILEKIIQAELLRLGWRLVRTHDLMILQKLMVERGSDVAHPAKLLCERLSEAYFVDRYPGFEVDDADWPNLRADVIQVEALLGTVEARVRQQ